MADFVHFEADVEGDDEQVGKDEESEVSDISNVDSESLFDDQEVNTDVNFYRQFANVENDSEQVLKDTYN